MSIIALRVVVVLLNDSWGGNSSHLHVCYFHLSDEPAEKIGAVHFIITPDSKDIPLYYRDVIFQKRIFSFTWNGIHQLRQFGFMWENIWAVSWHRLIFFPEPVLSDAGHFNWRGLFLQASDHLNRPVMSKDEASNQQSTGLCSVNSGSLSQISAWPEDYFISQITPRCWPELWIKCLKHELNIHEAKLFVGLKRCLLSVR